MGGLEDGVLPISCSICLEDVSDCGDRSWAKLQCGHQFHLDCIGSAFNVKGVMQCPNCRKIEKGQWLYADGCRPFPDINIDELVNDEDVYDHSFPESSMWCPFGGFSRVAAAILALFADNGIVGQHAVFSEEQHSATRMCPHIAYVGRYDNNRWNNTQSEIPSSYNFPTIDLNYAPHVDHPFLAGQSSTTRGHSSINGARAWDHSQPLEPYFHQPNARDAHRSNTQLHVGSSSDQTHGVVYYPSSARSFHDAETSMLNNFHHVWESEPHPHARGPFHQPGGGPARPRYGSLRVPSHGQYFG
ncbi:E3 ubiquitin-protein ligase RFI2-like isoform X2 [Bidens hawaiensis]|uniref:E3 ubiquitin-protein ligase RFI2-like isoform X2 n=1 Tax=Bidens hawaiensis TaxID=980011 RepID=UPI00404ACE2A